MFMILMKRLWMQETHQSTQNRRKRIALERLEDRLVLDTYIWTGADNVLDPGLKWSNPKNWSKDGGVAGTAPGANDDVVFDGTGFMGTIYNSHVDSDFVGRVKSITIAATYTKTMFIDKDLQVDSELTMYGGNIAGTQDVQVGVPNMHSDFSWTDGTIGGQGKVVLVAGGQAWIGSATATKTLSGSRTLDFLPGSDLDWDAGKIVNNSTGKIMIRGTASIDNDDGIEGSGTLEVGSTGTVNVDIPGGEKTSI